jgi:hypothetical protein
MIFQPRADQRFRQVVVVGALASGLLLAAMYLALRPQFTRVGYTPEQPVPFSHELHVGGLGMSCIYCHSNVERSPHATVPDTQTCMNCHQTIKATSPWLSPVRESFAKGTPIEWKRVHRVPDYVYFNHAQHVNRGVGCVSCHGQVNEMPIVRHEMPLSMSWCLDCHKHPETNLRPPVEATNMQWQAPTEGTDDFAKKMQAQLNVKPPQSCQGCHR